MARLRLTPEGALSNPRVEQYALLLADDVSENDAWKATGTGNNKSGGSRNYRANVHKSQAFKARLEALVVEKDKLEEGGPLGKLQWMANQIWRHACARNDLAAMGKAADLMAKTIEKMEMPPPATKGERGPGAPVHENPQTVDDIAGIKERLALKGIKVDQDLEAIEVAGEA